MDLKCICILFLGFFGVEHVYAGCADQLNQDNAYIKCLQGFGTFFQDAMASGAMSGSEGDPQAIMGVFCSPEGKAAIGCIAKYYAQCPELELAARAALGGQGGQAGNPGGLNFTEIELQGGMEVYCELINEGCMPIFQKCIGSMGGMGMGMGMGGGMEGGDGMTYNQPNGEMPPPGAMPPKGFEMGMEMNPNKAPTPYSVMPMQLATVCGPMQTALTCIFNAFDQCPNTATKMEKMLEDMSEKQKASGEGVYMPTYAETKQYITEACPNIPEMNEEKMKCLAMSTGSAEFVGCFQNVTENKKKECDVYFGGKACLKKHVEPTCGKPYADALVEASHLFSEEIPGNCEPVSGVSIMQASVLTLIAAGSLLILGRV